MLIGEIGVPIYYENDRQACAHFYMIAKPNGLLLILLIILLTHSISYFLQKNVSDFCFVRLSSFFAHNLFTNFLYYKTIKNNNKFLIDFFILSSLQKPALCRFLFYQIGAAYSFSIIFCTFSTSISNKSLICAALQPFLLNLITASANPSAWACSFIP